MKEKTGVRTKPEDSSTKEKESCYYTYLAAVAVFARESDERKIDRERAVVGGAGCLLVRVGARELVGQFARPLPNVALVVGLIVVLVLCNGGKNCERNIAINNNVMEY